MAYSRLWFQEKILNSFIKYMRKDENKLEELKSLFPGVTFGPFIVGWSFPRGAAEKEISAVEKDLGISFPPDFRKWYLFSNGAIFDHRNFRFFKIEDFAKKNKKLRGSWFGSSNVFFAESDQYASSFGFDYYFLQYSSEEEPQVFGFASDPTKVTKIYDTFSDFLKVMFVLNER